jgi:hypothetical protein
MEVINGRTVIKSDGIQNDIDKNAGFVLTEGDTIIGYSALLSMTNLPMKIRRTMAQAEIMSCFIESLFQRVIWEKVCKQNSRLYRNICAKQQLQRKADTLILTTLP